MRPKIGAVRHHFLLAEDVDRKLRALSIHMNLTKTEVVEQLIRNAEYGVKK